MARLLTAILLIGIALGNSVAHACQTPDKDTAIAKVLAAHPGGKILKVEETANGTCGNLKIRVLVKGTVKVVVIKGS